MTVWYAGVVTLLGTIAIFAITIWLIFGAKPAQSVELVAAGLYKVRRRYFLVLMVVLAVMLGVTLPILPYRSMASVEPEFIVPVTGRIWLWEIGPLQDRDGTPVQPEGSALVLPLGVPLEFQVTAADVNHGFGIYNEAGELFAQTQAMPGYANSMVHTFTEPGEYHVLCMEYCGIAHHSMVTTITVE